MGQGTSKSDQHVFSADTPVRFSQAVIDSLQNSPETDSTRAKTVEFQIQSRVTAELERIRESESQRLNELAEQLTSDPSATPHPNDSAGPSLGEKIISHLPSLPNSSSQHASASMSSQSVNKEVQELRAKLEKRRKDTKPDEGVEKAKESLVQCLRVNDRRPLDCWQEVESFKAEVGRLERQWVERSVR
ncbi:hypothetical protein LTR66_000654 [Elasticomyces elasticus]|nr:hypothetical protein LTR66_000654 [Elasticomyces elasticus]